MMRHRCQQTEQPDHERTASVDAASKCTNGAEMSASTRIGQATILAMRSALCWPRRLGTSSPKIIEK